MPYEARSLIRDKGMNDLTQKLIIALVIVPILLAIFRGAKEMAIAAGAIGVALFFVNIDKFSRFKGGGIEAELRTAVDDAYAVIDQLKELGLTLTSPIVDEMAVSGNMLQYIHLKYKLERVAKIADTLHKLGASDKEVADAGGLLYQRVTSDHLSRVFSSLRRSNPGKEASFESLDRTKTESWDTARLEAFIEDNGLTKSEEVEEYIRDLEYFVKNRRLRRESQWQG